jgi:hypothetical protein
MTVPSFAREGTVFVLKLWFTVFEPDYFSQDRQKMQEGKTR